MTPADLRRALELLPPTAMLTLSVEDLRGVVAAECTAPDIAPAPPADVDEWLTAEECAERLNVSVRWCYDHADELGAKRLSRRCVRFSARAVTRRMTRRS